MRELQPLLEIYDEALRNIPQEEKPDLVMIDGFGRWHERGAGLATAFGVERGVSTIGIGKEYCVLRPDLGESFLRLLQTMIRSIMSTNGCEGERGRI